jgi:hypothetical protein
VLFFLGKIVYRNWEQDQGLEDIQAKIYTEVSKLPATAEEIRERNIRRDPQMTRYALTEEGEPLAYVTSRDSGSEPGRTYIGYPWAKPECPKEVQEKIFNELMDFLDEREDTSEIATTIVLLSPMSKTQFEFFKKRKFVEEECLFFFNQDINIEEASKWQFEGAAKQLSSRLATSDDLALFYEISNADTELKRAFPDEEAMKNYFENRVLKDGHAILLFDDEKVVAASAPLRIEPDGLRLLGDEDRIIMRFTAIHPDYIHAWKRLVHEVARECVKSGWTDVPLMIRTHFNSNSTVAMAIPAIRPELRAFEVILKLQNSKE